MAGPASSGIVAPMPPGYLEQDSSLPLFSVSLLLMVLQSIFVAIFFVSRILSKNMRGLEFWVFLPAAYVFCMAHCINGIMMVKIGGAGRHTLKWMIEKPDTVVKWLKIAKVDEYSWAFSVMFPKLAITWLYMRIFTTQGYRKIAYATAIFVVLTSLASCISSSVICRPAAFFWDKTIPDGHCGDVMLAYRVIGFPNLLSDVVLLILPLPAIAKLHVDIGVKIGLFITFLSGSFGIVTSIIRISLFFTTDLFADPTYNCITTMTWTTVEPCVYLIAACMPSIRPMKKQLPLIKDISFSKLISSTLSRSQTSKSKESWNLGNSDRRVYRTTDIELRSTKVSQDEAGSMTSTTMINPPKDIFVSRDAK